MPRRAIFAAVANWKASKVLSRPLCSRWTAREPCSGKFPTPASILNLIKLEEHFQKALGEETGVAAAIDCGASYRANKPGDAFECEVVGGLATKRDRVDTILVRIDRQGNLTWQPLTPEGEESLVFASSADSDSSSDSDGSVDSASSEVLAKEQEEEKFQPELEEDEDSDALD